MSVRQVSTCQGRVDVSGRSRNRVFGSAGRVPHEFMARHHGLRCQGTRRFFCYCLLVIQYMEVGLEHKIQEMVEPLILHAGMELINIEYLRERGGMTLRITIDKEGGITVDDCAFISRLASDVLDVKDPIQGRYNLEVSSPGINRPLVREKDFERFSGEKVFIRTKNMLNGRRRYRGILEKIDEGKVFVKAGEDVFVIPLEDIARARLDII